MRILWINPAFRDYRVPVYAELDRMTRGELRVVYSRNRTPHRVIKKVEAVLGPRAIGLAQEWVVVSGGSKTALIKAPDDDPRVANSGVMIPLQPGLLRTVLRHRADVVICEGFFQWTPVGVVKRVIQNCPAVLSYERTVHTERNCQRWRTAYRRAVLRLFDAAVCNGQLSKEYLQQLGMPADRIVTGGMAADSRELAARVGAIRLETEVTWIGQYASSKPVFLYVGRLIALKGVAQLLAGWELYKRQHPDGGVLTIVGSGSQMDSLQAIVRDRCLAGVTFVGQADYDQIARFYAGADILVMPTLEDNWSLVVPEAMACSLPILCSRYNGCWPELVHEGRNGWIFDPLNADNVAYHLSLALQQQHCLSRMGAASAEIEKDYWPDRAAHAIFNACEIAIRHRNGTSKSPGGAGRTA